MWENRERIVLQMLREARGLVTISLSFHTVLYNIILRGGDDRAKISKNDVPSREKLPLGLGIACFESLSEGFSLPNLPSRENLPPSVQFYGPW